MQPRSSRKVPGWMGNFFLGKLKFFILLSVASRRWPGQRRAFTVLLGE